MPTHCTVAEWELPSKPIISNKKKKSLTDSHAQEIALAHSSTTPFTESHNSLFPDGAQKL